MNLAIIQARVGSQRLPGKTLADVCGHPLLWYVVQRTKLARLVDQVVVATPDTAEDMAIHAACDEWGVTCVAGPGPDVLKRLALIAELWQPDLIVRITADCPLIDPDVIDATIEQLRDKATWASNIQPRTWPDGLDVEVVTRLGLQLLDRLTDDPRDREHVTPLLYQPKQLFGIGGTLQSPVHLGDLRWTVDTQADLDWVRQVYQRVPWNAGWSRILFSGVPPRKAVA